ncbi:nitric-oxide synthase [Paenibacillus cellulosilyticus]|uniref:Nitric oxide synthase oxygenase n=1 Tax=Paenibacillus cellulosilyticus TaxID=375489 RepID=A0A2V2Z1R4_9BACL|nr:nitric oxide synthase oxygenase [Paenibacillus cellulosilyticus]PWW06559.1 nitric-oxide synthase [Paenibacillus cellulosilyticus]QKS46627.1 nitric oxide synthase oxygenase [Paenibacillus cellulosilyticus]
MTELTVEQQQLMDQAAAFIRQCYGELARDEADTERRITEVMQQIARTGTYRHTTDELTHGARLAWRNSNRCIGRLFWQSLSVLDARDVETADEAVEAIYEHMAFATNNGRIRPAITIFAQEQAFKQEKGRNLRIWNHQLVRYAGYEQPDGTIIGDPHSVPFTRVCESLGWRGKGTPFDVLPLVIGTEEGTASYYVIPEELVLQVPLTHPTEPRFAELELQWYAVPFISEMVLEIGGIRYPAAPFNGWYMGTEIGARNLSDANRYNMLRPIAERFGFDMTTNTSLWKDRALVELNAAVLHSYKRAGVSIVDHHTAAEQFGRFEQQEHAAGRTITGRWSWLIPPMSPSTTAVWHRGFDNTERDPKFGYQPKPYATE